MDENGDIGKVVSTNSCTGETKIKMVLTKSPFNSAQCIELSSKASQLTGFFQQNRIRCIFITKGYYGWVSSSFNGDTDYKYKRPTMQDYNTYQLYVLNIVYDSKPSNVIIQVPINALNCGGLEKIDNGYKEFSWMSNIELPDFTDIVNYDPGSGSIPASKQTKVYDFASQGGYQIQNMVQNAKLSSSKAQGPDASWYIVKMTVPPVQNITYVCTNCDSDIVGQGSNAHPLLIGTDNGLYKLGFDGTITKVIDSGTVKRIVRVRMGSYCAYICLFSNGKLMGSSDNGATWEDCGGNFPSEQVVDIATDICNGTTNNTAILTSKKLYFGHVIQKSTEV